VKIDDGDSYGLKLPEAIECLEIKTRRVKMTESHGNSFWGHYYKKNLLRDVWKWTSEAGSNCNRLGLTEAVTFDRLAK
jgi:hypothetical protein